MTPPQWALERAGLIVGVNGPRYVELREPIAAALTAVAEECAEVARHTWTTAGSYSHEGHAVIVAAAIRKRFPRADRADA